MMIIDDFHSSARFLNPLGRALLEAPARRLSARVTELAAVCGWPLVDHSAFAAWVESQCELDDPIVVLDKLLFDSSGAKSAGRSYPLRAHRRQGADGSLHLDLGSLPIGLSQRHGVSRVTLVDDAAYTSGTLATVVCCLDRIGVRVHRVLLAVSTLRAEARIRAAGVPDVRVFHPRRATGDVIHARDLCLWCPFSGRASTSEAPLSPARERIAPLLHLEGAWLTDPRLASDPVLFELVADGIAALGRHLGRNPHPVALSLLGPNVAIPVGSGLAEFPGLGLGELLATHRERRLSGAGRSADVSESSRSETRRRAKSR